jgi:phosphoserine phosphatase
MSLEMHVATLVAPAHQTLRDMQVQVEELKQQILATGGKIEKIDEKDGLRAADIFFAGGSVDANNLPFDVIVQPAATRRKKILVADMESTIIAEEMLDELAAHIGVGEEVADITRRAMNGELDFAAALTERVSLLKGQPERLLDEVAARMTLTPGAQDLVDAMKRAGGKAWLVSGGFTFFVKKIAEQVGFDGYFCNDLKVEDGLITGEVTLPILDKNTKKDLLEKACTTYGCTLAESLAVGDGANDVPMLQVCNKGGGLGVAYHAKPKVRETVFNQINRTDLSALIYAQGYRS